MTSALWLARQSLALDRQTLRITPWPLGKRYGFIVKKYALLGQLMVGKLLWRPFRLGKSNTRWAGERIYYDSRFGLAGYQRMLTTPVNLFRVAGVKDFGVVIDCGANVGFFSKMILQLAPQAHIYAIEPVPTTFECLQRNMASSPNVQVFQTAILDHAGRVRMAFDSNNSAISQVSEQGDVEVPAMTLDDFAAQQGIGDIDLLKIDTESFEAHVLRGARSVLARTKYLLIEITFEGNQNYTLSSLMSLLQGDGYDFQLAAFRNYADVGEGPMPIMDCLMVNRALVG
ncbi:MAG TPA: FkbM family methyltransferase [Ktedonobacterales bacterium]